MAGALDASREWPLCQALKLANETRAVWASFNFSPEDRCLDEGEMDILEMVSGDGKAEQPNSDLKRERETERQRKRKLHSFSNAQYTDEK